MTQVFVFQSLHLVSIVIQDINIFTRKIEITSILTNIITQVSAGCNPDAMRAPHHGITTNVLTLPVDGSK